jgi:hypothetical protein
VDFAGRLKLIASNQDGEDFFMGRAPLPKGSRLANEAPRSRAASFGLCPVEAAIGQVLLEHISGLKQIKIVSALAKPFESGPDRSPDMFDRIWENQQKIYASCGKMLVNFDPALVRFAYGDGDAKGGHPTVQLTDAGSRLIQELVARNPSAASIPVLLRAYYSEVDSGKKPKILTAKQLQEMNFRLKKSRK